MTNTYNDAVKLLTSSDKFKINLGLERISKILELLGNPQDKLNCIHVAGTNGKGSVCAILSSILTHAGKKVGLYTSPHIFKYTERFKICGTNMPDDKFAQYIFKINEISEKNNIVLTEFEILTAVMFKYFCDNKVDVVVLETGLGGKYDATNVIKKNLCSVITHIDLEHTEKLGNTISEIAEQKAGIIKPNCPCIVFEGFEIYHDIAKKLNSLLMVILPFADTSNLSLKGSYQQENLALALAAIETIFPDISQDIINEGLKNVSHPFRFQYFEKYNLIIDGAHNPNGISSLRQSLDMYYPIDKRRYIFGCLKNKNYKKMISELFDNNDEVYFYHFSHINSCPVEELQKSCQFKSNELTKHTNINFNDGKLNIICGSFYMIAELIQTLKLEL